MQRLRVRWIFLGCVLLMLSTATSCFLETDREIDLDIVYPTQQQSEVTVRYRVPPPPSGKVYVLWVINPDNGSQVKIGQVPPTTKLSIIRTTVNFFALGAIVSIESSPDVTQMSNTWALKAGQLDPTSKITPGPK